MTENKGNIWTGVILAGLVAGGVSVLLGLVGMVAAFNERYIVTGVITMGQLILLVPILAGEYNGLQRAEIKTPGKTLAAGAVTGIFAGLPLTILLVVGQLIDLRQMFPNASPELYSVISFGIAAPLGYIVPIIYSIILGFLAGLLFLQPRRLRSAILNALMWVILIGLFRDMFALFPIFAQPGFFKTVFSWIFAPSGLSVVAAIILFVLVAGISYWRSGRPAPTRQRKFAERPTYVRWIVIALVTAIVLYLPQFLGVFFTEVMDNVGIYIIMALGLNIVVGYAGLLDLGYVAFFAIGAYAMGVFTSPELGFFNMGFWTALPFALLLTMISGVILGLPVLRMRGDYLAIVTLGFGEIVRLLALSEWLRPYIGGTQGIQRIAIPIPENIFPTMSPQMKFYYLILAGCLVVGFIAWRLKDSRLGRNWIALREDEDVAQAMGLNTVTTKLLAFATGATFAGLSGAIFASKLNSAYPHSFDLLVSIFVLCIIIIGGMGSIPGAVLGAFFLIGLPELLREFSEFRLLVVGVVMVAMMLYKPEGLWPEERRKLELHEGEDTSFETADDELTPVGSTPD
ncbi:MAG: leucine/isoleucine/valine transporter permease subunit [Chloroflexota bacterium]|nr:MAG: leucine/isoleucine/valine transporter permease subunit [Chloroflexota bacterium]